MKRTIVLISVAAVVFAGTLFAEGEGQQLPRDRTRGMKPEWIACSQDQECDAIEVGCYYWAPVNKKFAKAVEEADKPKRCERSISEGPKPELVCVDHKCVIAPKPIPQKSTPQNQPQPVFSNPQEDLIRLNQVYLEQRRALAAVQQRENEVFLKKLRLDGTLTESQKQDQIKAHFSEQKKKMASLEAKERRAWTERKSTISGILP